MNALKSIANMVEDRWYPVQDMGFIVGYHMKLAGVDWCKNSHLVSILAELVQLRFLEPNPKNTMEVRVAPHYIPKQGEAHE